jgi:DNA-binding transcriptional LysR family regulator
MHDLDSSLLRTFLILAETRSFSRTGLRVGRSQSAISGQIRKLEDQVRCRLIDRSTRHVELTRDGERLLGYARQIVETADALLERFRLPEVTGDIRFGSPEDFATMYLPNVLGSFARVHQQVMLHVTCDLTLPLLAAFEAGELDLVVIKQDPRRALPEARPLRREELVWVAGSSEWQEVFTKSPVAGRVQRPLPLIAAPAPCVYRSRASESLDALGVPWSSVYSSPSFAGALAALRAGLGVGVMPRAMVPADLIILETERGWPPLRPAEICLLERPGIPAVQSLAAFIIREVNAQAAPAARPDTLTPSAN